MPKTQLEQDHVLTVRSVRERKQQATCGDCAGTILVAHGWVPLRLIGSQ